MFSSTLRRSLLNPSSSIRSFSTFPTLSRSTLTSSSLLKSQKLQSQNGNGVTWNPRLSRGISSTDILEDGGPNDIHHEGIHPEERVRMDLSVLFLYFFPFLSLSSFRCGFLFLFPPPFCSWNSPLSLSLDFSNKKKQVTGEKRKNPLVR